MEQGGVMATRDAGSKKRGRPPNAAASEARPEARKASTKNGSTSDAVVGFEEKLWQMADKLRNNMDGNIDVAEVVYRTLLTDECREYCRQHATGTKNLGLSREDFLSYPIVVATASILDAFNWSIRSLSSRAEVAVMESRALGRIRDELLPRLLSGALSVAHAEREVEAVA